MPRGRVARHRWRVTTDHGTSGGSRDRNGQPWWLRPHVWAALLIVAAVGVSMLLTGCGSSGISSPTSVGSKKYREALAFVQCMRTHGEPTFPDPSAPGQQGPPPASAGGIDPSLPVFQAAARACDLGLGRGPRGPGRGGGG
jgi:hypothetical protein